MCTCSLQWQIIPGFSHHLTCVPLYFSGWAQAPGHCDWENGVGVQCVWQAGVVTSFWQGAEADRHQIHLKKQPKITTFNTLKDWITKTDILRPVSYLLGEAVGAEAGEGCAEEGPKRQQTAGLGEAEGEAVLGHWKSLGEVGTARWPGVSSSY